MPSRLLSIPLLIGMSIQAHACNIPVFRYALERWRPDLYEVIVFYDSLTPQQEAFVAALEASSSDASGTANWSVVRSPIAPPSNVSHRELWKQLAQQHGAQLPYLLVRTNAGQGRAIQPWHGPLGEAPQIGLLQSPARKELIRRLLNSHSVVWLMIKSLDESKNAETRQLLQSQCETLSAKIKLPDGIGLPGSELHSEVPLLVKFSVLEIDPSDPKENFLVKLLSGVRPEADLAIEPLVVPVFGRGRALEVIPSAELNESLIEDLTVFLGGACSCQVKERNPGFDLLLETDWDRELFGENGLRPPPPKTIADNDRDRIPTLLAIPPGRKK